MEVIYYLTSIIHYQDMESSVEGNLHRHMAVFAPAL